jgi:hypothetical protein
MQRACWQDEDEVFDDGPTVPHVRTVAPWEVRSNTSQENREEEEMYRAARLVKVKALWAAPSECDLDAQFEKELAAHGTKFALEITPQKYRQRPKLSAIVSRTTSTKQFGLHQKSVLSA